MSMWALLARCASNVSEARVYIGAAAMGAVGAMTVAGIAGRVHGHHGHHHGHHGHLGPREMAELLKSQGQPVPVFLAPPHVDGHVPVHSAVVELARVMQQVKPASETLDQIAADFFGRVHPAFPPHDVRHKPPHAIALAMHEELGLASPYHGRAVSEHSFAQGHRHRHGHGHGHGHPHQRPHEVSERLQAEGRAVPAFLLPRHSPEHVPPHEAVRNLAARLATVNSSAASLTLVSVDFFGRVHPAFPPHDVQHQPMHAIALAMHEELGASSPYRSGGTPNAGTTDRTKQPPGDETAHALRRLEERVVALEAENRVLRQQNGK